MKQRHSKECNKDTVNNVKMTECNKDTVNNVTKTP